MKILRYLIPLMLLSACTNILDKDPIAIYDAGTFFQTGDDALQVLNAAYGPLLFNNDNGNYYWAFAEITSDEAITGGDGSRPGLIELEAFTYTPRTEEFNTFWKTQYEGITQSNLVLDNIGKVEISEALRERYTGEALFLRAYYHFLLTQIFGDVPLLTALVPPDELRQPASSQAVIFAQIIADCERAAPLLPITSAASDEGRATRGAALALAAKVSLYEKNWPKVLDYVAQIKALGAYALVADYADNYGKFTQNNSESVWEIQHANLELGLGNFLNQWWASRKIDGYGFAEVTPAFVEAFEPGDPRLSITVAMRNDDYFGRIYTNSFSTTRFSVRKYIQSDSVVTQKADGDINYTAIRYAEVLLWQAEALVELNRPAEALEPLEMVRARARAQSADPATTLPAITTTNQAELRQAVRHERQVELGFEMHRFFDLVRWDIAADLLPGFEAGKHEVFPIPQTEIDLNPLLVQHPGY
ncbi:MAG: RagB/SusD family nutrient uptake outer membrane protein [Bacteroidetes bacterium]|nr:MAG: RagB/SusD family nutrient uptake outer membrane protein [Bacteroidota bacterium]PTM14187.1 MAG: RagB/SusD family nutrient uptake outer membrane protein [Bacteroidota bacterium]